MTRLALLPVAMAALAMACADTAAAAEYTADDFGDASAGACLADPDPSPCNLRGALTAARFTPGETVIKLLPGVYTLSLGGETGVDDNNGGDLDWSNHAVTVTELRIEGAGSGLTTITTAPGFNNRIIEFFSATVPVALRGVTLKGGVAGQVVDDLDGGGLRTAMAGSLSLSDVRFVDNRTLDINHDGGGLASINNTLVLDRVSFAGNRSARFGGGMALKTGVGQTPTATITNSTFTGNSADGQGGGAIANMGDGGPLADPVLDMTNSTLDGNRAIGFGGGIDSFGGVTTSLTNTTVTRNLANYDGSGGEAGGGLQNGIATYGVRTSLIALNTVGAGGFNPNCSGSFSSQGDNVLGDLTGCAGFVAASDLSTPNPLVGALSANGGSTLTVPLLAGSPAIDHTTGCPATDQRGTPRPQGAACDAGAFEFVAAPPPTASPPTTPSAATTAKKCKKPKKTRASAAKKRKKCTGPGTGKKKRRK